MTNTSATEWLASHAEEPLQTSGQRVQLHPKVDAAPAFGDWDPGQPLCTGVVPTTDEVVAILVKLTDLGIPGCVVAAWVGHADVSLKIRTFVHAQGATRAGIRCPQLCCADVVRQGLSSRTRVR